MTIAPSPRQAPYHPTELTKERIRRILKRQAKGQSIARIARSEFVDPAYIRKLLRRVAEEEEAKKPVIRVVRREKLAGHDREDADVVRQ